MILLASTSESLKLVNELRPFYNYQCYKCNKRLYCSTRPAYEGLMLQCLGSGAL